MDNRSASTWSQTLGIKTYVWRSVVGFRKDGSLVFVTGASMSIERAANVVHDTSVVRAINRGGSTSSLTPTLPWAVAVPYTLTRDMKSKPTVTCSRPHETSLRSFSADENLMNVLTSVAPRTVQDREVSALITIQTLTSSPAIRQGAVMLSHLGEHALLWTVLGLAGSVRDRAQRRAWLRASATVVSAHAVSIPATRGSRCALPPRATGVSRPAMGRRPLRRPWQYSRLLGRPYPLLPVPVMMASRVILGVHYPSDVLAGSLLGAVMGRWVARAGRL